MADISQEELSDTPINLGAGNIFRVGDEIAQEHANLKSQDEASLGQKGWAFYDQALKVSTGNKVTGWAIEKSMSWESEDGYAMDDDIALGVLDAYNLNMKYFGDIRNTQSTEERYYRIAQALREQETDQRINTTLGEVGRTGAMITGSFVDIDLAVGFTVGMATKSSALAKVMMWDGVAETSLVATRFMVNKDYTAEDALFDMTTGLAITAGANKLMHSFKKPNATGTPRDSDATAASQRAGAPMGQETPPTPRPRDTEAPTGAQRTDTQATGAQRADVQPTAKTNADYRAEINRVNEVRKRTYTQMGLSKKQVDELEARKVEHSKMGLTPDQAKRMDTEKPLKSIDNETARILRTVDDMSRDMKTVADDVYALIKQAPQEDLEDLKAIIDDLVKQSPKEMAAVKRLYKSKLNNKKFDKVLAGIEGLDLKTSTKKKLLAASVVLGATGAQAAEDDFAAELTGMFLLAGAAVVFGPSLVKKVRNANIRQTVGNISGRVEDSYHRAAVNNSTQGDMVRSLGGLISDELHTRITSTVAPYNKAGGQAKKIMNDLVYSTESGAGAETTKAMWAHGSMFKYARAEQKMYRAWKAERKITMTSNILDGMNAIHKFRQEVMDNMELRNTTSPAVKELTAENDKIMQEIWDRVKEYDVYGFEKINYKAGMMPRLWKSANLNDLVNKVSTQDQFLIRDTIANAIAKTSGDPSTAIDIADKYMDSWIKGFDADIGVNRAEDIFGSIGSLLKDDVDFEKFADAMNVVKDKNSRAQYRVDFDINDIQPITVNIDGVDTVLTKAHFVERDFKTVLDRVANSMYGSAAIAKRGYKSRRQLDGAITTGVTNPTMRSELKQVADLVMGVPIASNNKFLHEISMITKDLTMVAKLPFVVFSMPPELIATLGNAGFTKGVRAVKDAVVSTFGKDSAMLASLSEVSGLGTSVKRMDTSGYRGLTDDITELDDAGITSKIRENTMKLRDFSMLANGLSYFSDVLQRANLQLNAEKFANFVAFGKEGGDGINKSRLKSFGIDDDTIKMFENTFEFNEKGKLKDYDISKWPVKKRDKFGEILRDMNQAVSPETTIGETGLYTRTTDLGRALSTLISYPMQQFNIHGLEDLKHFDRMTFLHSVGGFAGAYLGLHARYAAQGKEVDDDKILLYALLNVPQLGGLSAVTSMTSPATLDTIQSALNIVGMDKK
jgi:hypothetical protein